MVHANPGAAIDLQPLQSILNRDFHPDNYEDAQELILAACLEAQNIYGWVPEPAAQVIAEHLGVTINRIYGLLTFYADFRTEQPGKHFMLLCHGAACYVMGSQRLIEELRSREGMGPDGHTSDGEFTVQIVNGCLGVCDLAPVVQIDHHTYCGRLNPERLAAIVDAAKRGESLEDLDGVD